MICAALQARTKAHAYLRRATDLPIRRRCCYCTVPHPMDGLGPIRPDELVSDGLCAVAFEREMRAVDEASR